MPNPSGSSVLSQGQRNVSQYTKKPAGDTPEEQLTPERQDVPDSPIRMQSGFLACRTCGLPVPRTADADDEIRVAVHALEEAPGSARTAQNPLLAIEQRDRPRTTLSFALCPTCRQADELAEQLAGDPATRSPWGRQLVGGAMDALLFLNARLITSGEIATFNESSLTSLVRRLGSLGVQVRWSNRDEVDSRTCNPHRFAHLRISQRSALRDGYAHWLRERSARRAAAIKIGPPPVADNRSGSAQLIIISDACLICGIATQTVAAATVAAHGRMNVARDIWRPLRTNASQLGERSSLELSGYLCKICADAVEQSHSVGLGPTALERCLVSALVPDGIGKLASGNLLSVSGLQGWGALAAARQTPPNAHPFEHAGDLDELRKQLKARLNV